MGGAGPGSGIDAELTSMANLVVRHKSVARYVEADICVSFFDFALVLG